MVYKIQCDKNLLNVLKNTFSSLGIEADISIFTDKKTDISIIRTPENLSADADYLIINSDDKALMNEIKGVSGKVITCGLSSRSTVTFSSIDEKDAVMCIQRSFNTPSGKKISPFELPFKCYGRCYDDVSILMIITAALLCGAKPAQLEKIYL